MWRIILKMNSVKLSVHYFKAIYCELRGLIKDFEDCLRCHIVWRNSKLASLSNARNVKMFAISILIV